MSFQGYTDEAMEWFMAIRFNNNRDFFRDNRDWYLRAVRAPSLALAEALAPAVEKLDDALLRIPARAVSRVNRDLRFSNDKTPYRDHVWLAFRRPGDERKQTLGAYFEMGADFAAFGIGYYGENRPRMNALRRNMRRNPDEMLAAVRSIPEGFELKGDAFKRLAIPEDLPARLEPWYRMRAFYLEKALPLSLCKSPALVDEIAAGYAGLKPLYDYVISCMPEEEDFR